MSKEQFATILAILSKDNPDYAKVLDEFREMYSYVLGVKQLNKLTKNIKTFKDCQKAADLIHLSYENTH